MPYVSNTTSKEEMEIEDRVVWRRELLETMHVSSETMRRWLKAEKLPKPDVNISKRTKGWRLSTLRAAGIMLT